MCAETPLYAVPKGLGEHPAQDSPPPHASPPWERRAHSDQQVGRGAFLQAIMTWGGTIPFLDLCPANTSEGGHDATPDWDLYGGCWNTAFPLLRCSFDGSFLTVGHRLPDSMRLPAAVREEHTEGQLVPPPPSPCYRSRHALMQLAQHLP